MTRSVNTSQSLPQPPLPQAVGSQTSGHGGRKEGYARAQHNGLPLTEAGRAMAVAGCPVCPQQDQD